MPLQLLAMLGMVGLILLFGLVWLGTEIADDAALEILPDRRWLALIEASQRPPSASLHHSTF